MATRFAGDFFGISLVEPEREESKLLDYYPELRRLAKKSSSGGSQDSSLGEARSYGGAVATPAFSGFKTLEKEGDFKAAPLFYGFKTFDQPKKS